MNVIMLRGLVWAGIHFRTADMQGALLGKTVAHDLKKHDFQRVQ
jgi:hypothetical protein